MQSLNICDCDSISDLSAIADINSIETLDISFVTFGDDSFLNIIANLNNLKSLNAKSVRYVIGSYYDGSDKKEYITDISGFENLVNLEELNLQSAIISDISPLSDLRAMKDLYLDSTQIMDFSAIKNMTKLENLNVTLGCSIDLLVFKNLTNMKELSINVMQNYIDGEYIYPYVDSTELLRYISKMNSLESLSLRYIKLSDVDVEAICSYDGFAIIVVDN